MFCHDAKVQWWARNRHQLQDLSPELEQAESSCEVQCLHWLDPMVTPIMHLELNTIPHSGVTRWHGLCGRGEAMNRLEQADSA